MDRKPGPGPVAPPPATPPVTNGSTPPGPVTPPPPVEGVASPRPWQRPLGIAATVAGAVGLGVGTALGFLAKSSFNDSNQNNHCDAMGFCDSTGLSLRSDAVSKGNIGTGVFVAGAVLAAGGIVLWVTAPSAKSAPTAWQAPEIGVGPTGFAVRAAF
jgi:hypothetical protein